MNASKHQCATFLSILSPVRWSQLRAHQNYQLNILYRQQHHLILTFVFYLHHNGLFLSTISLNVLHNWQKSLFNLFQNSYFLSRYITSKGTSSVRHVVYFQIFPFDMATLSYAVNKGWTAITTLRAIGCFSFMHITRFPIYLVTAEIFNFWSCQKENIFWEILYIAGFHPCPQKLIHFILFSVLFHSLQLPSFPLSSSTTVPMQLWSTIYHNSNMMDD